MKESQFRLEIKHSLSKIFPGSVFYTMSNIFGSFGGAPDLIGCIGGYFVAFECKLLRKVPKKEAFFKLKVKYTTLQEEQAERIKKAGGLVFGLINIRPLKSVYVTEIKNVREIRFSQILRKVQGVWELYRIPGIRRLWEEKLSNLP